MWTAVCAVAAGGCGSFAASGKNAEGVRLFEQARYQEAMQQFFEATNCGPNDPDGYYNLASTYHRLGTLHGKEADLKQAEHYYRMCLDRDPDHRECYRALAVLLIERGRAQEAVRLIEEWADRRPALAAPRIELARLHEEFGDLEAAKTRLQEALACDYDNPRALAALGKLREQTGERLQALSDYKRSLWNDRFQPELAARVAALKSTLGPQETFGLPAGDTQIASGGSSAVVR